MTWRAQWNLLAALLGAWVLATSAHAASGPEIQGWETADGVPVLFVQADAVPIVDLKVVFDAGSARDGDRQGLARLTSRLLARGTEALDEDEIAREFESLGARFNTSSGRDQGSVSLRSLADPERLDPALDLMAEVMAGPVFPEAAFERERSRMQVALSRGEQSPGDVTSRAFMEVVYGDHPYGNHADGTREGLERIDRADVEDFHARYYTAANALVAIVGDVSRDRARAMAESVTGRLPEGEAPERVPAAEETAAPGETRRSFPSNQSHILFGQPGIARDDPDYYPLMVGNHALGASGLTSRLFREVRQKRGLSYGAGSHFATLRARGPFLVSLQTANHQAEEALQVARDTVNDFLENGPTEEELELARDNLTGGFPMRIDTNSKILDQLVTIGFHGLPLDTLDQYTEAVEAVDREMVRDAFRRHLDPESFATVVVGGD